jgi:hypothetical protein
LLNACYRGVYVHGRIKKARQGRGAVRVTADPSEVMVVEIPEWRIVDDATWFAVKLGSRRAARMRAQAGRLRNTR